MSQSDMTANDATESGHSSRREFLGLVSSTLAAAALAGGVPFLKGSVLMAADGSDQKMATMKGVSRDTATIAGEPLTYLVTPNPEISSGVMTIPPGTATEWMVHPVQGFVYVLDGTLTVEYADGPRREFQAGHGFPQARSKWHRGRNDGKTPVRFLAVFFGAQDAHQRPAPTQTALTRAKQTRERPKKGDGTNIKGGWRRSHIVQIFQTA